jgi:integrase
LVKAFTVKGIDAVLPAAVRIEVRDGRTPGLCLVVQPSGHKSFAYRYRSPLTGRPAKLTLGAYPGEITLEAARTVAQDARRAVAARRDPGAEKKAKRYELGNEASKIDHLLDDFVKRHVRKKNKTSTGDEVERLIERRIKPAWKGRSVQTITKRDVTALLQHLVTSGAPVSANRVLAIVRKFFRWVISEHEILQTSPAAGVVAPTAEESRNRVLTDDEVRALWSSTEGNDPFVVMVRLLLVTGQRRGEVAGMRWDELVLDGDEPTWTIPAVRAKNKREHTVPLAPVSVALIRSLKRIDGSDYVLTTTSETPISGFSKGKSALDKAMLEGLRTLAPDLEKVADWRLHDLRRTFASGMAQIGQPIHVVERLLNHISGSFAGIVGVYQRYDFATEKRAAANAWASRIGEIVADKKAA